MTKKKSHHQFYVPWYAGDEHTDSWFSYLHRNLHHLEGEDYPFIGSEWRMNLEDAELHDEVLDALYQSDEVDASRIALVIIHGTVQLVGCVSSMAEKKSAEKIVRNLHNVWDVINVLVIQEEGAGYRF